MLTNTASAACIAAVLLLAGCSGNDSGEQSAAAPAQSAKAMRLTEVCPEVETALPQGALPSVKALRSFAARLDILASQGDLETQNALRLLQEPTEAYVDVAASRSAKVLDADRAWLAGIDAFAKRCKAAGSSALQ